MRYLFIHDAFPGQFIHLFRHLYREMQKPDGTDSGSEIIAASRKGSTLDLPVEQIVYDLPADAKQLDAGMEAAALGHDLYCKLKPLADAGRHPDYIVVHASTGASYFLRDLFPKARITCLLEWYYRDPSPEQLLKSENAGNTQAFYRQCASNGARNSILAHDFDQAGAAYAPTGFQKSQFPARWQPGIKVCHEGIDTDLYRPDDKAELKVGDKTFTRDTEIITYAARGMEKSRGFPQFMLAVAEVQKKRPKCHVIVAAKDRICYDPGGRGQKGLKNWAEKKVGYDPARTHFVGLLPEREFVKMLQISRLHVYLSIPFVLSWSCLNAMSAGVPLLASDNASSREVITGGENGLLVDAGDVPMIAKRMIEALDDPQLRASVAAKARDTIISRFKLQDTLRAQLALIHGEA